MPDTMPTTSLNPQYWLILILGGYLCGSIPWGLLIARSKGVDIRKQGSGNIGATNVGRVLGRKLGLLCFFLDMLKGVVPVLIAGRVSGLMGQVTIPPEQAAWWLGAMIAPVLGHVLNPWLAFKGGKGVATSLGALLGVYPVLTIPGALAFCVWLAVAIRWRFVSLASLAAGASLPFLVASYFAVRLRTAAGDWPPLDLYIRHAGLFVGLSIALAGLVFITHRTNIKRLMAGTENRIGHSQKKARPAPADAR